VRWGSWPCRRYARTSNSENLSRYAEVFHDHPHPLTPSGTEFKLLVDPPAGARFRSRDNLHTVAVRRQGRPEAGDHNDEDCVK
jgi:hypothetical protein